jgi:hypothetical protein
MHEAILDIPQNTFKIPLLPSTKCVHIIFLFNLSRDNIVGIITGYGLDNRGTRFQDRLGSRIFSSHHPDQLWGSPSFLSNGYQGGGVFPRG